MNTHSQSVHNKHKSWIPLLTDRTPCHYTRPAHTLGPRSTIRRCRTTDRLWRHQRTVCVVLDRNLAYAQTQDTVRRWSQSMSAPVHSNYTFCPTVWQCLHSGSGLPIFEILINIYFKYNTIQIHNECVTVPSTLVHTLTTVKKNYEKKNKKL